MHEIENGETLPGTPSSHLLIPSNSNPPFDFESSKQTRIMESFKAALLHRLTNSLPNKALSPAHIATIERRLQQSFPFFRIPTHPTYASMIQTAIEELEDEGGSMESSISEYIVANYQGLPWAHKTYLSHYLNKLCESGEIMCTSTKGYTIPGLVHQPKSKKKQFSPKPGRKRHDEGNLIGGELLLMNDNEVCFQEEETQVFMRNRLKRRRSSSIVYEEDEEVEAKDAVGRDTDKIRSNKTTANAIEEQHELSEPNRIDEVGKGGGLMQHGFGTNDKVEGTVIMEQGLPNTHQVLGWKGVAELQEAGLVESAVEVEESIPKQVQDEVLPFNHDSSEQGRTGLLLPLVPSTLGNRLPGECENEAGADTLPQCSESSGADLVPVDGEDPLKKSAKDHSSCPTNLMIVPFKEAPSVPVWWEKVRSVSSERKQIIVCGLPSGVPTRSIRKPTTRSKDCQKKPLLLVENIVSASTVSLLVSKVLQYEQINGVSLQPGHETKLDQTILESSEGNRSLLQTGQVLTSSPPESTPEVAVKEAPLELEMEKQKLHLKSSPSGGLQDLSKDDEDLNLPLQQVVQKCGKQRKLSEGITLKAPVAPLSSMGANLEEEPPGAENMAMLLGNNKLPRGKKKKLVQQEKIQLRSQGQKCEDLGADKAAAPKNVVFSSRMESHDHQDPQLADSLLTSGEKCIVECVPGTVPLDAQCHELGENQQKMRDQHISIEVEKNSQVCLRESSLLQNPDGEKGEHTQQSRTEMVDVASSHPKPETAALDNVNAKLSSSVNPGRVAQQEESLCPVNYHDPKSGADEVGKTSLSMDMSSEQQNNQTGLHCQAEREARDDSMDASLLLQNQSHQKQEAAAEASPNLVIEVATVVHQLGQNKGEEAKNNDHIPHPDFKPTSDGAVLDNYPGQQVMSELSPANVGSQGQHDPIEEQQRKDEFEAAQSPVKRECRGRPRKEREEIRGVSYSLNLLSPQQNKPRKKDGRGRPKKRKETDGMATPLCTPDQKRDGRGRPRKKSIVINSDAAAPLNLLSRQQKNKQPKRDGRGRPRKRKEVVVDEAITASSTLHDEQKNNLSDPETHQHSQLQSEQPEGDGSPQKQSRETEDNNAAVAVQLDEQLEEGPSNLVVQQNKRPRRGCRGRPRKQDKGTKEEVGPPLNFDHQQKEDLSEPATQQIQSKKQKRDGCGSPLKEDVATKEGVTAALDLDSEELEGPSQLQHGQGKSYKPEAAAMSLDSETLEQCQEGFLNSTTAPVLTEDEYHQLEMEHKPLLEKNQLHSAQDKQPGNSQHQNNEMPCDLEEVTVPSVNESPEQSKEPAEDGEGQFAISKPEGEPTVNQSCEKQEEEEQCQFPQEKQVQSRDQGKTPKQKPAKSRPVEVPLSSKAALRSRPVGVPLSSKPALRSRTKCLSQSGT